eukprot:990111-Prorocentrum_minimum.AAC.1
MEAREECLARMAAEQRRREQEEEERRLKDQEVSDLVSINLSLTIPCRGAAPPRAGAFTSPLPAPPPPLTVRSGGGGRWLTSASARRSAR